MEVEAIEIGDNSSAARALPSLISPTKKVTVSPSSYSNLPFSSVTPLCVSVSYFRPVTGESIKTPCEVTSGTSGGPGLSSLEQANRRIRRKMDRSTFHLLKIAKTCREVVWLVCLDIL